MAASAAAPVAAVIADPLGGSTIDDDPLGASIVNEDDPLGASTSSLSSSNPLAAASASATANAVDDSISAALTRSLALTTSGASKMVEDDIDDSFEPWTTKRSGILAKYTTSEKLSIISSFLQGTPLVGGGVASRLCA